MTVWQALASCKAHLANLASPLIVISCSLSLAGALVVPSAKARPVNAAMIANVFFILFLLTSFARWCATFKRRLNSKKVNRRTRGAKHQAWWLKAHGHGLLDGGVST